MQNTVVKNVLAALFLVVLCFIVGAQAAESAVSSAAIIAVFVGGVFLLWLGPRCWVLIYLLPPVMTMLPLPGKIAELPTMFLVSASVLIYWVLMYCMGYVRFVWRSLFILDVFVLIIFAYMVASYMRHPVSMAIFGWDAEYVGGKEYVWVVLSSIHYLALSCIPCSYEQFRMMTKWGVRISVFVALLSVFLSLAGIRGGVDITELGDAATSSRFSMFVQLGVFGIYWFYGMNPILRIFASPFLLVGCVMSLCGIILSGAREYLMSNCFVIAALSIVKRELWCLVLLGLFAYGGLLFLSAEGILKQFPHGIQRSLSVFPNLEIERDIREGASHSSEWRIVMWKWALDSRNDYIKDYMWGDGFGQSVDYLRRETVAMMRGTLMYGDQEFFANTGVWHSGYITTIHRLGYVGLVLVALMYLVGLCMLFRVCGALRGTSLFFSCVFFCMSYAGAPFVYFISAGTLPFFFKGYLNLAFIKLFYCVGREQGFITPWMQKQRYVPQVIREHGDELRQEA